MIARGMRGFGFVGALAIVLMAAGCKSHAADHHASAHSGHAHDAASLAGDAQRQIPILLDQYTQALPTKDLAALDRIGADDLSFVNLRGDLLGKQDRIENLKSGATELKSAQVSDVRVRSFGQAAVATCQVALEAQYSSQETSGNYRVTTVWARPKGPWQMVGVQMTRIAPPSK